MNVIKVSISLSPETVAQLEYLRDALGIYPNVKRSQLIAQIIFECYTFRLAKKSEKSTTHMTSLCHDDCMTCDDAQDCLYSQHPTKYK